MDNFICCIFNLFDANQTIMVYKNGMQFSQIPVAYGDLPEQIAECCDAYDITKVKLIGDSRYAMVLANDIEGTYYTKYTKKDLNIEVN